MKEQIKAYHHFLSPRGFYRDILDGLESTPKFLPAKYLYNDSGDRLLVEEGALAEYYFLDPEVEILTSKMEDLAEIFRKENSPFDLIEFCSGPHYKRSLILRELLKDGKGLNYFPVDISSDAINALHEVTKRDFPSIRYSGFETRSLEAINQVRSISGNRKVILLLDRNISDFSRTQLPEILTSLRRQITSTDLLVLGFEMEKSPQTAVAAYSKKTGLLRELSLNLLNRINRELNSNFPVEKFEHFQSYDPILRQEKSYMISCEEQMVNINGAHIINFDRHEPIEMGISQNHNICDLEVLARRSGFRFIKQFSDTNRWFTIMVWATSS
ncbi:L-histidine N(alpha)-methyltransferase [Pedobacter sp.]|uniref:L-histidine N(alpha)-methyltransferase n=1 Tax=Pedobacter sp. TaxID=1411316 RepID=UPI003C4194AB